MISIVIPARDDDIQIFTRTLESLNNQKVKPKEIILVDSSSNNAVKTAFDEFDFGKIKKIYKKIPPAFAGKSTNHGLKAASSDFIGLLDTKTLPDQNWIRDYLEFLKNKDIDVVFGSTKFFASSSFQNLVKDCSYGNDNHETVPGTIFRKSIINKQYLFNENSRSGYDIEWRARIKKELNFKNPDKEYISYETLSSNIKMLTKKYFSYSFSSALIDIQSNQKEIYLSIFLVLSLLIVPRWNYLIGGWDANPLYIPDIAKKYLLAILVLFLLMAFQRRLLKDESGSLSFKLVKFTLVVGTFYLIYNWNAIFAGWIEDAIIYIPHITKIFVSLVLLGSFISRGIISPISKQVPISEIFPFRFLQLGALGIYLDLVKFPGYVLGGILQIIRTLRNLLRS